MMAVHPWVEERRGASRFGVQVATRSDDPNPSGSAIAAGLLAEEVGLDAFFLSDHPGYLPEPWLHLAAVAVQTSRIGLGSVVNCALHRHPVYLARLAADLDNVSDGRLILGLGMGWNQSEFDQLGLPFPPTPVRQEALTEAIEVIRGVWGAAPFDFTGKHWWTKGGHVLPPPVQQPGPPLMIAGSGEKVTLRQVATYGDACNFGASPTTGAVRSTEDVRRKLAVLGEHCRATGRDEAEILKTHFTSWLMLGENEAAANAKRDHYFPDGIPEEVRPARFATTPEGAIRFYQELADAGIDYFVVQSFDARDVETIRLLARAVAPNVRPRA